MENLAVQQLYSHYQKAGGSESLELRHFETLMVFFPCLLVVASDGVVDKEELVYVQYLAKFMAESYKHEVAEREVLSLQFTYYRELSFLLDHLEEWREPFLEALGNYLEQFQEIKETVHDTIYLFADASEGTSESEDAMIAKLVERLKLEA